MEGAMRPSFQNISTRGVEPTERIVNWGSPEHANALALALLNLEPLGLDDDAEALDEEDATEDNQHQLLVDNQGTYTNDTANGQRTRIAQVFMGDTGSLTINTWAG